MKILLGKTLKKGSFVFVMIMKKDETLDITFLC